MYKVLIEQINISENLNSQLNQVKNKTIMFMKL